MAKGYFLVFLFFVSYRSMAQEFFDMRKVPSIHKDTIVKLKEKKQMPVVNKVHLKVIDIGKLDVQNELDQYFIIQQLNSSLRWNMNVMLKEIWTREYFLNFRRKEWGTPY